MRSLISRKLWAAGLTLAFGAAPLGQAADSIVRAIDLTMVRGETNRLHVMLDAQGTENAVAFSLCFDTNLLTFVQGVRGPDATNAGGTLIVGTSQATRGRVGFILGLDVPSAQVFSAGTHRIVEVLFRAAPGGGVLTTPVTMCDLPTTREVSDPEAGALPASYVDAMVTLAGSCGYALGTNAASFLAVGGSNSVAVLADPGCAWTVSNPLAWVSILSGGSGSGTGTVAFAVEENLDLAPRSGGITIAGRSFTVNQAGFVCAYTLSPTNRNHGSGAATNSFAITAHSSCAWTVSNTNAWITLASAASGTGTGVVHYTITANPSPAERVGQIHVADQTLTLRQSGLNCGFSISPTNRTHGAGAATNTVSVMANPACAWSSVNTNSWITLLSGASGLGDGTLTYAVSANASLAERMGVVVIAGESFLITQRGVTCEYSLSPTNRNHGHGAATNSFTLTTDPGCAWTVDNTNDWIQMVPPVSGSGPATCTYSVVANPQTVARTGLVFVAGQVFVLSQNPAPCTYAIAPSSRTLTAAGATGVVAVTTPGNCAWNVENTNSWITIDSGASGLGDGTVGYTVASNASVLARSGVVVIAGRNFTVNQAGAACPFTFSPPSGLHGAGVSTGQVSFTTDPGCVWTVANSNSWIVVLSGTNGTGDGSVTYVLASNADETPRVGLIVVGGLGYSIEQAAACGYRLSPTNRNHGSGAATNTLSVITSNDCPWSATSTNAWISLLSGANGPGPGMITYAVAANPSPFERTGHVMVADKVLTLRQSGITCSYSLSPTNRNHGNGATSNSFNLTTSAGCPWSVVNGNSWILITSATNGTGAVTITYAVAANPDGYARTGLIQVASQVFTLTQNPATCNFALLPTSRAHGSGAESGQLEVDGPAGCPWNTTNTNSWITVTSTPSGVGPGMLTYAVETNPATVGRSGVLSVAGRSFTVNQSGAPCAYTLSPTNGTHGSGAETGQVSITTSTNCSWSFSDTNDWINVLTANGTGSGTAVYSVEANLDTVPRTGLVSIAGIKLSIVQAAGPCVYRVSPVNRNHGPGAATNSLTVSASNNCPWAATTSNSWITLLSGASGTGTGQVAYALAPNGSPLERTGHVQVADQVLTLRQSGIVCSYSLSPTNRNHGYGAATNSFSVNTSAGCSWLASTTNNWVVILSGSNGLGGGTVTYAVDANPVPDGRTGHVQVADSVFIISQEARPCSFSLSPTMRMHGYSPATNSLALTTLPGCVWTVVNTNPWVSIASATSGTGDATIEYTIAANTLPVERVALVQIADETFTLTQRAAPCLYELVPTNRVHGAGSETGLISVLTFSNCSWTAATTNDWITLQAGGSGLGNGSLGYSVAANTNHAPRNGYIELGPETFRVTQAGAPCLFALTPTNAVHGAVRETGQVSVASAPGCSWNTVNTNDWIDIDTGHSGDGNGVVTYIVSANPLLTARAASFLIAGQNYTVSQAGRVCAYRLSPTNRMHGYAAASNTFAVTASNDCAWAASVAENWISLTGGASGLGNGTVSYSVAANPAPAGRTGLVTVADQVFTVVQSAAPCTATISPLSRSHGPGATSNSVSLTTLAECPWDVVNTNTWITFSPPASGVGSAILQYAVEENPDAMERVGLVFIAGQMLTLTQRAAVCTFALSTTTRTHGFGAASNSVTLTTMSNCAWTVLNPSGWIHVTSPAAGVGGATVHYNVEANTLTLWRTGVVTIADQLLTLLQRPAPCQFAFTPSNGLHSHLAVTAQVSVATSGNCPWDGATTNAWIQITGGAAGTGDGTVTYALEANGSPLPRAGALTVGDTMFVITQAGVPCQFSLSPTNRQHGSSSETGLVSVITSNLCPWSVVNTNGWITVLSAPGSGSGDVTYSVDENPNIVPRSGVLVVGGQPFQVSQQGAPCVYRLSPTNRMHGYGATTGSVNVTTASGCEWSATTTNEWIGILAGGSGSGNDVLSYALAENQSILSRTGAVLIAGQSLILIQQGASCAYSVSPSTRTHGNGTVTNTITVTTLAGCPWDVINTNAWITILSAASGSGSASVQYRVLTNEITLDRVGVLVVAGETVTITQRAAPCVYVLSPTNATHDYMTQTGQVSVTASSNCPWTVANTNYWITILTPTNETGSAVVRYAISVNMSVSQRTGSFLIAGQEFVITQLGSPCVYAIEPASRHHGASAETGTVAVTVAGGCEWTTDNTNSWIAITAGLAGSGSGTVAYEVQANPSTFARTGVVMIAGQNLTVSQAGGTCTYATSPSSRNFTHLAGSGSVSVTTAANCPWTAVSTNDWITITSPASSNGTAMVSYNVAANPTGMGRTGVVQIAGLTLTVSQAGIPCAYAIVPPSRNHGYNAETGTVTVTSAIGCSWTANNTNSWITILAGPSGSGTGTVTYALSANPTALLRSAVLSIAGSSFAIQQAAAPCTFTLAPSNVVHGYAATTGSVGVVTLLGCTWGVTNTNSWITITSGTGGTNSDSVRYSLAENPVTLGRTGFVFIASQRLSIIQEPAPCAYALAPGSRAHGFSAETGLVTVTTSSNCPWTVTNTYPWITLTSGASRTGSGTVGYSLAANPAGLARSGVLFVDGQTFTITQAPAPCVFGLQTSAASHAFGAGGGSISLTTLVGCAWAVVNTNAWISITSEASGTNSGTINYAVAANPTGLARTGMVSVAGLPFAVTQAAAPCTFTLSDTGRSHGFNAESASFDVTTLFGCPWTISNPSSWITITGGATRTNSGTVSYSVQANPTGLARTGLVSVAGQTFTVTQAAAPCTYALMPASRAHGFLTETGSIGVTTLLGCEWTASAASAGWLTILSGALGTNSGNVSYRASSNDTAFARTGTVSVAGQTFTVTQAAAPCSFALSPTSRTHGFSLETGTVSVSTLIGCTWSASTTNHWIAILAGEQGTNSGTVTYVVDVNPTAIGRTGTVSAAGQTVTVVQSGAPCTFTLAPLNRSHAAGADTGSVSVTTLVGCVWSVGTTNPWISISGGAARTNSGSVTYSVAANPTALVRTGLVTMAGQSFLVTQAGAACSFSISPGNRSHGSGAEAGSVTVTTLIGCGWTAASNDPWLSVTAGASGTNNGGVSYSVAPNPTAVPRSGSLTIAGQTFTVDQSGAPCTYSMVPASWVHRSGADTGIVAVTTLVGCNWTVVNPNSWITVLAGGGGSGSGGFTYTVEPNTGPGTRTGALTVGGQAYTVSQLGTGCGYRLSPTNRFHGFGAATNTISVTATSGCPWSVVNTNPWITLVSGASGTGNGTVTYSVSTNRSPEPRTALLNIGGESFTITQWGTNCSFALTPRSRSHGSGTETGLVMLSASSSGCAWTVQNTNSWFTMLMPPSGTGGTNISYTVNANPTIQPRSGSFTIGGETFTVSQAGAPCAWTLAPSSRNHGYGASTSSIAVTTLDGCAWTVENTNYWITILSGGGSSSSPVFYAVQSNEMAMVRSGVLVIGGQSFTVTQDPAPCAFVLEPMSRSHSGSAEGGLISVSTLMGCGWMVLNTNAWVTITAGSTGITSGTILYTVDANPSATSRTGTLAVDGQVFTILQAGAGCSYSIAPTTRAHGSGSETGLVNVSALAGCAWLVNNPNPWITITSGAGGGSGIGTVGYAVAMNASVLARTGLVTIAGQSFAVTQAGLPCTYAIAPESREHGRAAGSGSISVTTSNGCTWTASTSNSWIQITSGATGSGNGTVNYAVTTNTGGSRVGLITVAGRAFAVSQEGSLRVVRAVNMNVTRGQTNRLLVVLESQGDENALGFSLCFDTNYLTFVRTVRGSDVTNAAATFQTNLINSGRGQLGFAFGLDIGSGQTFNAGSNVLAEVFFRATPGTAFASTPVTLCSTPIGREISDAFAEVLPGSYADAIVTLVGVCSYALNTNAASFGAAGGAGGVTVATDGNCAWTVSHANSWIQVTSGGGASGGGQVSFIVEANGSSSPRTGVLTIAGQTFTVNQQGAPCTFTVSPTNVMHGFGSETGMVSLATAGGCAWTVINTNSWLTFAPESTNGSGSASIGYAVTANPSIQPRSGNVLVDGQVVTVSQEGAPCLFAVTPASRAHLAVGGTGLVSIATTPGCPWSAVNTNPWITITAGASGSGSGSLGYRAAVNYFASARTGAIVVADQVFTLTQTASTCGYSISPSSRNHTYQSGNGSVNVSAGSGCAWDVINTNTWISVTSSTNDTGSDTVNYTVSANPGGAVRSGTLIIAGRVFTITQDQSPCAFAIAPTSGSHGAGAQTGTVSVATFGGCAWSARTTNTWITVLQPTNGVGIGSVTYAVLANPTAVQRTGYVFIADQLLPVMQAGAPCTYIVAPSSRNHGAGAETNQISVTALTGCAWTAVNPNAWITLPSGTNGSGTGSLAYVVAANPTGLGRSGTLTVAGQSVTINQAAAPCSYSLSQGARAFGSTGGTGSVSLTTLVGCAWTVGNANPWIQLISPGSGSGSAVVDYSVQANPTSFARTGTVSIAGQTHVVTQAGAPCTYSLAATNASFGYEAATGTVALSSIPGCSWTAGTSNSWITVVAPTNGTGSADIAYRLAANPASLARTGSVQVGGQTLLVTQSGAPCLYVLTPTNRVHESTGGAGSITLTVADGCAWSVVNPNTWISLTTASSGTGSAIVGYSVQANLSPLPRTGILTIGGQSFEISQVGITCDYLITPTSQILSSGNVTGLVSVSAISGCSWVTVNTNPWIAIKAGESGTGNGLVRYTAAANPNPSTRVGFMTVAGHTFTVTQLGTPCSYTLAPTNRLHGSGSETGLVSVFTVMECAWSTVNTNPWITLLTNASGMGNATIAYQLEPNPTPNDRTGYLTVGNQSFSVMQLGAPCSISLTPTNFAHGPGAETGTVAVATLSGCPWTVTRTNSWITILSPVNGLGTGVVTYAVSFNTNLAVRTGVIRIGGQSYTLSQEGMLCTWTPNTTNNVHGSGGGSGSVTITTSNLCPWSVSNTNSWITFPAGTNYIGTAAAAYTLAPNFSPVARIGTIVVAGTPVTIGQAGINCTYSLAPSGRTHSYHSETSVVAVTTSNLCQWTVSNTNDWITILGPTNFSSSINVIYVVAANSTTNARSGYLTLASNQYAVTQIGLPFVCASNQTVECGTEWAFEPPVPAGMCPNPGATLTVLGTVTNIAGFCGSGFAATRTWLAVDGCGASMVCTQMIRSVDAAPPLATCAPNKTVDCGTAWSFDPPTALDSCSGTNVNVRVFTTVTNMSGACGNTFTAIRIWEALDGCGNRATCSQTVQVRDVAPPVLTCAANKSVECGAPWSFDAPAVFDACGGAVTVNVLGTVTNAACGNTFTATRSWEALDGCTNRSTCSQTVQVVDSTPPVFTCPATKVVECGLPWGFDTATATDSCGSVSVVILSTVTNTAGLCGNTRTATRTWQATDACGNTSLCSQLVRVVDTAAPVIVCPPGRTVEFGAAWNFDNPTVFDSCSGASVTLRIVSTVTNTAGACGNTYTAIRTWDVSDGCSNRSATCSQSVRVVDTTAPALVCPANKTVNCTQPWSFDTPTATDTASGTNVTLSVVSTLTNGACGGSFTITRTWRATDACTNTATCSQTVAGISEFTVAGSISFPTNYPAGGTTGRPVVGVAVLVTGATNLTTTTVSGGAYSFAAAPLGAITVTPTGGPTNSPSAGVSTVDISLIRRHVLNIVNLDSPYKLLAGDVNGSGSVSTLDISFIRRLILAATNSLPMGLWRYVPADHVFPNPASPWSAPSGRTYATLTADLAGQDFVALKLGDVNSNWLPPAGLGAGGFLPAEAGVGALEGPGPEVTFAASRHTAKPGDIVVAQVTASGLRQVTSAQGTLAWDPEVLQFNGLGATSLNGFTASSFGTGWADEGRLAFSWDDPDAVGVTGPDGTALFSVSFLVLGNAGTMSPLMLTDGMTPREVGVNFSAGKFVSQSGQVVVVETALPQLTQPGFARGAFGVPLQTAPGKRYVLEYTDSLPATNWIALPSIEGDGTVRTLSDPNPGAAQRFYRVRIE